MPLETGTLIHELVETNPAHSDGLNQTDSHLRLLKSTIKATFPNINSALNITDEQLNALVSSGYLAPDGTVSLPSHSFVSEPALGLYRLSAGRIGIAGRLRGNGAIEPGAIVDFARATAPTGYLVADGASLLVADQPDLFAAIGYLHGGSGLNFNLPDYRNRYRRHREDAGAAGAVGTLQADQNKAHTHGFSGTTDNNGAHTHYGTTNSGGVDHTHAEQAKYLKAAGNSGVANSYISSDVTTAFSNYNGVTGGASAYLHTHVFLTDAAAPHIHWFAGTTASSGSSESRPLSATVLTCIKT